MKTMQYRHSPGKVRGTQQKTEQHWGHALWVLLEKLPRDADLRVRTARVRLD
jgi:hypothetical protein